MQVGLARRAAAEALGAALLAGVVIGSGVLAERLSAGNDAIALLGNTAATGAILYVLVTGLGPLSGAHFNPAVSLIMALRRELSVAGFLLYAPAQVAGCVCGAMLAHAMFDLPLLQVATQARQGVSQVLSEGVATFALVFAILTVARWRPHAVATAVALVITAGYWWTASTSFANPAITIARAMSDTFAGVRPADAPGFIAGQFAGALAAWLVCAALLPKHDISAAGVDAGASPISSNK
ncbi:MAG: aquaporin [Hyphomonadaceae bacterium]|nr:aquaporin [Hyphomonadaceae bacterium]